MNGAVAPAQRLSALLVDGAMRHYFGAKFPDVPPEELDLRIEELLRFLFIAHECKGSIPVSRDIDQLWHAWILQTQEYGALCEQLPTGRYVHHSSNDYLRYFDPQVGEQEDLREGVRMLALYTANFGPFEADRARHWLLVQHLLNRWGWTLAEVNDWLLADAGPNAHTRRPVRATGSRRSSSSRPRKRIADGLGTGP